MAHEVTKKICLLGDPSVGKTSLIRRFVLDEFDDSYISTIGTKVTKKELHVVQPDMNVNVHLTLMIWDVAGQHEYQVFHRMYLKGVEGALLVCDLTRKPTVSGMMKYVEVVKSIAGNVPVVFLFNKCDLVEKIVVDMNETRRSERYRRIPMFKTSAKTGENVENAFRKLSEMMISQWLTGRF